MTVSVNVRPAKDHPVDLYYLMDMSNSMKDDLEKLKTLAGSLGKNQSIKFEINIIYLLNIFSRCA